MQLCMNLKYCVAGGSQGGVQGGSDTLEKILN